jgi:hypothetical protein
VANPSAAEASEGEPPESSAERSSDTEPNEATEEPNGGVVGGAYFFNPRWSLDGELGYAYIPTDDIVTHEFSAALSGAYHF